MKRIIALACTALIAVGTPALAITVTEPDNLGSYATWDFTTPDVQPTGLSNHTSGAEGTFKFNVLNAPDGTFKIVKTNEDFQEMSVETSEEEYFSAQSPFGTTFGPSGPSSNVTFLKVRLDGTAGTATTTFTFNSAMPANVFGAAFNDLDFDNLTLTATNRDGSDVSGADLNGATFNMCEVTDSIPAMCAGATLFTPTWDATAKKFISNDDDSDGAAGTITPASSIKSITTLHETGSPNSSVRTWFAVKSATVCGKVKGLAGSTASLTLHYGKSKLASTTTGEGGSYCFPKALAVKGYSVTLKAPKGKSTVGASTAAVTLAKGNATKNFTVAATASNTTATTNPGDNLPTTGPNSGSTTALVAALVLMCGAAMITASRLRQSRR